MPLSAEEVMSSVDHRQLSVWQVVPSINANKGGLPRAAINFSRYAAATRRAQITLFSQANCGEDVLKTADPHYVCEFDYANGVSGLLAYDLKVRLARLVRQRPPDIIHSHGLWSPANYWACNIGARHSIATVIHPHGMLEKWALEQKKFKKILGLHLYQRRQLEAASILIASSPMEYEAIRVAGLRQPVAIIPNGVEMPVDQSVGVSKLERQSRHERNILFLSRLHPKKGLMNLLSAWAQIHPPGWRLLIAGGEAPAENYRSTVESYISQLGLGGSVDLLGEVYGDAKEAVFRSADLFVLPSFSESFGIAVAEALSYGVPVIATHGTPWSDLREFRCGWWVEVGIEPLRNALLEAMSHQDETRLEMGLRGREYVKRFGWQIIGNRMLDVYAWVAGMGDRPPFVEEH